MALHKTLGFADVHVPYSFEYDDSAARTGASGLTAADIGKFARQLNQNTVWMLTGVGPLTWKQITTEGHGQSHDGDGSDPTPLATTTVAGLLSAIDKVKIDAFAQGNVTVMVRNETGSTIPKGTLLSIVGYSVAESRVLVQAADKDDPTKRPCVAVSLADILNNTNTDALHSGVLDGVDTTTFSLTDQLVLGNAGAFIRPPPDNSPFTGEVQNVGSVARVHATLGQIVIMLDGLQLVTGDQVFALTGTDGTPGPTNKYVTNSDPRNTNARAPTAHAASHLPAGSDPLTTAVPVPVGVTSAEGSAASFARSDHVHKSTFLQSVFAEISVDTTTTSVTFVTLLSQAITIQAGSILKILFTAGTTNSGGTNINFFRVQVDGATRRAVAVRLQVANTPGAVALTLRVPGLASGARTVTVQWRADAGTAQVRPVAAPDSEHASLLLEEVTV